jgi:hypothetical protein
MTTTMHALSLYLDTSVIGGYYDAEFMADTRAESPPLAHRNRQMPRGDDAGGTLRASAPHDRGVLRRKAQASRVDLGAPLMLPSLSVAAEPTEGDPQMSVTPFKIDIPQAQIDDLKERLTITRWPAPAQRGQPSVFGRFIRIRNSVLARPAWLI